jgi:hypothetical protein
MRNHFIPIFTLYSVFLSFFLLFVYLLSQWNQWIKFLFYPSDGPVSNTEYPPVCARKLLWFVNIVTHCGIYAQSKSCEASRDSRYWVTASQISMFPRQLFDTTIMGSGVFCAARAGVRMQDTSRVNQSVDSCSWGRGKFGNREERKRPPLEAATGRLLKTKHAEKT